MALTSGLIGGVGSAMDFSYPNVSGAAFKSVSLGEMLSMPTQALPQIQANLAANWQGILIGSAFTAFGYKITKRLLRMPIRRVNTALFGKRGIIGNVGFKL
jgi:hypothetical protein